MHQAAQVMDHPADLIKVAIEDVVRQRFELPAFSTLDTLAMHVRVVVRTVAAAVLVLGMRLNRTPRTCRP